MNSIILGYWLSLAFCLLAIACACLLMYVMVKYGEQQRANKKDPDPQWLQASRKSMFFIASSLMTFSAAATWTTGEISSYVVLILLASIVMILAFNAISQHRRTPPSDRGGGVEDMPPWPSGSLKTQFGHYISRADMELLRAEILRLDEGQMLSHKYLEVMHNHLGIKPEPAVIDPNPVVIHPAQFRPRKAEEK
jgi:hypothetical protein